MFSQQQIKKAKSCKVELTGKGMDMHFRVFILDHKGDIAKEHLVTYERGKPMLESLDCDCDNCTTWNWDKKTGKLKKWCAYCIRVAMWLIQNGYWEKYVWEIIQKNSEVK